MLARSERARSPEARTTGLPVARSVATARNGTGNRSKIGALIYDTQHINEHYGNIVTYMRLQGLVPPSSAPRGGGAPR